MGFLRDIRFSFIHLCVFGIGACLFASGATYWVTIYLPPPVPCVTSMRLPDKVVLYVGRRIKDVCVIDRTKLKKKGET